MSDGELQQQIRAERKKAMQKVISELRYLCSCDAERMSDYQRINHFVRVGADAAALLGQDDG